MADKKITFLMPIYQPHFKYAEEFLQSFHRFKLNQQADVWFVFSNEQERQLFSKKTNAIVIPENLQHLERDNGIINVKKFYGLSKINDKYDYVITIDAETIVIKNKNLLNICNEFFKTKKIWGNTPTDLDAMKVVDSCRKHLSLKKKIKNDDLYLWFNNLCIYKTANCDDFFNKTKILEKLEDLSFWDFDYNIYMLYLILHEDFKIENIRQKCFGFSSSSVPLVKEEYANKFMHIATPIIYNSVKRLGGGKACFMLINTDKNLSKGVKKFRWLNFAGKQK